MRVASTAVGGLLAAITLAIAYWLLPLTCKCPVPSAQCPIGLVGIQCPIFELIARHIQYSPATIQRPMVLPRSWNLLDRPLNSYNYKEATRGQRRVPAQSASPTCHGLRTQDGLSSPVTEIRSVEEGGGTGLKREAARHMNVAAPSAPPT